MKKILLLASALFILIVGNILLPKPANQFYDGEIIEPNFSRNGYMVVTNASALNDLFYCGKLKTDDEISEALRLYALPLNK
jgi:hypothetical protein